MSRELELLEQPASRDRFAAEKPPPPPTQPHNTILRICWRHCRTDLPRTEHDPMRRCENCVDYSLCEDCAEHEYKHHDRLHVFLRVQRPLPRTLPPNALPYGLLYDRDGDTHWGYSFRVSGSNETTTVHDSTPQV